MIRNEQSLIVNERERERENYHVVMKPHKYTLTDWHTGIDCLCPLTISWQLVMLIWSEI